MFKFGYILMFIFLLSMMCIVNYNLLPLTFVAKQIIEHEMNGTFNYHSVELKNNTHSSKYNKELLVILFTTFSDNKQKISIFENTIKIWSLLKPFVQPILYCYNYSCLEKWRGQAKTYGWHIYKAPVSNEEKLPLLKYMYLHAIKLYKSNFYGYCNGDILFDKSFLKNFHDLKIYAKEKEKILVIGQRSNYHLNKEDNISTFREVSEIYQKAKLFTPWAIDYFIYTKNCINWEKIPNLVVGKEGWFFLNYIKISQIRFVFPHQFFLC